MQKVLLKNVANIVISNVDKKSKETEVPVILCNFTDVYYNWSITKEKCEQFMRATASNNEIEKFTIKQGDVAITKDSETRDDIGISTYFDSVSDNVLLGYHCALIRPNKNCLDGAYINALLNTSYAKKYFAYNASGSGQRFSLSIDSISNFSFELPSLSNQLRITNILGTIDKAIEIYQKRINSLENINTTIFEFILSNYSRIKYKIGEISSIYQPHTISEKELNDAGKYTVYGANGIIGKYDKYNHAEPEIALTCRGATCGNILITRPYSWITGNAMVISPKDRVYQEYVFQFIKKFGVESFITGSAQPQITRTNLKEYIIALPNCEKSFYDSISRNRYIILNFHLLVDMLQKIKDFILPLLMNGQVHLD